MNLDAPEHITRTSQEQGVHSDQPRLMKGIAEHPPPKPCLTSGNSVITSGRTTAFQTLEPSCSPGSAGFIGMSSLTATVVR
ncbi:hypothetical protein ACIRQP_39870 [Streptomyces sp. NPDC102274]|uniref:hypothetical protein n=1 Tax=Streptomyces sp. NPDC102274 TaxID=3366151 RepID=UPI003808B19D